MEKNKKAEFAVKILLEYAKENNVNGRDTTNLSPLEAWLIVRLYDAMEQTEKSPDDLRTDFEKGYTKGWVEGFISGEQN